MSVTVLLDAGHGVTTPGKRSPKMEDGTQLLEWEFTRDIANRIKTKCNLERIKCLLLNTNDSDPALSARANNANKIINTELSLGNKCIMISIHANAVGDGTTWMEAKGWEVYSTESKNNSDKLANEFCKEFPKIFPDRKLRGHKEKNFTVIYKTNCPCVLTENFFYDNKEECNYMMQEETKNKIAQLHINSIKNYIKNGEN